MARMQQPPPARPVDRSDDSGAGRRAGHAVSAARSRGPISDGERAGSRHRPRRGGRRTGDPAAAARRWRAALASRRRQDAARWRGSDPAAPGRGGVRAGRAIGLEAGTRTPPPHRLRRPRCLSRSCRSGTRPAIRRSIRVGPSVSQVLSTTLGQSSHVRTVPPDRLHQVLRDLQIGANATLAPTQLASVADFTSARHVLCGHDHDVWQRRFGSTPRSRTSTAARPFRSATRRRTWTAC